LFFGSFQKLNHLQAADAWKALQEILDGRAGFKVIQ